MKFRHALLGITAAIGINSAAQAAIIADIIWAVDTSGSMGGDIAEVKQRIAEFDTAMVDNGIDANYGLVRFGGTETLIQDLTDFATFTLAGGPFASLTANGGGFEDGSAAAQVALTASFRANSVRNIIIVTDEDDDDSGNRSDLVDDLAATAANELINVIANPNDAYYSALATNNGGQLFDILSFRNDPGPFFTNFVNTKVQEIIDEGGNGNVPTPATLALLGLGLLGVSFARRQRA
jgi:hypothetical protein